MTPITSKAPNGLNGFIIFLWQCCGDYACLGFSRVSGIKYLPSVGVRISWFQRDSSSSKWKKLWWQEWPHPWHWKQGTTTVHLLQTRKQSPRSKPGLRITFTSLWKSSSAFQTVPQAGDQVVKAGAHGGTSQIEITAKNLTYEPLWSSKILTIALFKIKLFIIVS